MTSSGLHGLVEAVFRSRGYIAIRSSKEARYILLSKEGARTAVSYGRRGAPPAKEELESFVSMAKDDSAEKLLFLAPETPGREARAVMEREKVTVWDRTALALALGEAVLSDDATSALTSGSPVEQQGTSGLSARSSQGKATIEPLDLSSVLGDRPIAKDNRPLAPFVRPEVPSPPSEGGLDPLFGGMMEALGELSSLSALEKASDLPETTMNASGQAPIQNSWVGCRVAPVNLKAEEACTKAGAQVDPRPVLELRPHLLLDVKYTLRSGALEPIERTKSMIVDMTDGRPQDIPLAISSQICGITELWKGPAEGLSVAEGADPLMDGHRVVREALMGEKVAQDKLVRDSLMSTIYQEAVYSMDPSSFAVLRTERVLIPFWVLRSSDGSPEWSVDAFLGRFFSGGKAE